MDDKNTIKELQSEIASLKEQLDYYLSFSSMSANVDEKGWQIEAATKMAGVIATAMSTLLEGYGAENFVTMIAEGESGRFTITVQRDGAKNPATKYMELKSQYDLLKKRLPEHD